MCPLCEKDCKILSLQILHLLLQTVGQIGSVLMADTWMLFDACWYL